MVAVTFLFIFILARLFYVEVVSSKSLQEKAIDQWTRELPVKAERGDIIASDGEVLATNIKSYAVYVRPRCISDPEKVASVLSELFDIDKQKLYDKIVKKSTSEITVKRQVSKVDIIKLCEYDLSGVYYSVDGTRSYPYGDVLCSVLGYTSVDGNGQTGLEKYYDKYLKGIDGEILYESDLTGADLDGKTPSYTKGTDGLTLQLNVDLEIQLIIEATLKKIINEYDPKRCSAIVMEPSTGKILAIGNLPSYDLNFVPRGDVKTLNELSRNTLIVDSYEPGSTFKIVTALADIEEYYDGNKNAKSFNYVFSPSRYREVAGGKIKCWSSHKNGKHYGQTLSDALNNSCNPCFTDIALSLGKDDYYKYVTALNFGKVTGVDFPGEASGMVIPKSAVTQGDLARIAFGQSIAVTPIQLAAAACAAVNGGKYYSPKLADKIITEKGEIVEIINNEAVKTVATEKASKTLAEYLEKVVSTGSGKQSYIEGYAVGGKTGTAQKYENGVIASGKYVMSFIGFFPATEPKYLCLLTVDEPKSGSYGSQVAAPYVGEIFQGIIDAKSIKKIK